MTNTAIADQLDDAIAMMISEPHAAPPKVDLKISELLGIAAELRLLPDPSFRTALKAELLGQVASDPNTEHKRRESDPILPTLFVRGSEHYPVHRSNVAISMAMHAAVLLALAASGRWLASEPQNTRVIGDVIAVQLDAYRSPLSGGGGGRDKTPESKGSLPRRAHPQITPPTVMVPIEAPKLAVEPTIIGPPDLKLPATQIGNPLAAILSGSNGPGHGGGMGGGYGGGVGNGSGAYRIGGGVTAPVAIYDPDPEYSEEARLAKYQGTVGLWVVVSADGKAHEIRVLRSLGMGLDEKAIEAVRGWKFEPGKKDGVPVAVEIGVDVTFRLF